MSTTAVVTPYEPAIEPEINEYAIRDEQTRSAYREQARKQRLKCSQCPLPTSSALLVPGKNALTLKTGNLDLVTQAARSAGYAVTQDGSARVVMTNKAGVEVSLARSSSGNVVMESAIRDISPLRTIAREYAASQIYSHLSSRNMQVTARRTPQGEIAIEARSPHSPTVISADIRGDGITVVDVSGMKGNGCQQIITDLSRSMEGSQLDKTRKNEYFIQAETKERIRV